MRRTSFVVYATVLLSVCAAAPASAAVTAAGALTGMAQVGRHFVTSGGDATDCTKAAKDVFAAGQGLYLPNPLAPATDGVWSTHTSFTSAGMDNIGQGGLLSGRLDVCGWLTGPGRHLDGGPACGVLKAHNGRGVVNFDQGGGLHLFEVGWKRSAGGFLPVTGKYQVWDGTKSNSAAKDSWGNLVAQGGASCADTKNCAAPKSAPSGSPGCGAQSFTIAGVFELVPAVDRNADGKHGHQEVIRPNDNKDGDNDYNDGPFCKDDLRPECPYYTKRGWAKEPPPDQEKS